MLDSQVNRICYFGRDVVAWVVGAVVLGIVYFYFLKRAGNLNFWKLVKNRPGDAREFFAANRYWHFGIKPADRLVVGPFLFTDEFGVTDVLYCDADKLAATQAEFVARFPH
jgi:hypothetical protein